MSGTICPNCGKFHPSRADSRKHYSGSNHVETHTPTSPASDPRVPGGTFESRQAVTNEGTFIGKTSVVKSADGETYKISRGKNGNGGPSDGFLAGLFNWLGR